MRICFSACTVLNGLKDELLVSPLVQFATGWPVLECLASKVLNKLMATVLWHFQNMATVRSPGDLWRNVMRQILVHLKHMTEMSKICLYP